jgi:hypothetical protein
LRSRDPNAVANIQVKIHILVEEDTHGLLARDAMGRKDVVWDSASTEFHVHLACSVRDVAER